MLTFAIDGSTKSTGFAVYKDQDLIIFNLFTNSSKNVLTRIKYMTDTIEQAYKEITKEYEGEPVQVVMEEIIPDNLNDVKWAKNNKTFKPLCYLQGAILVMFNHYNIEVEFTGASTWRRQCGIEQGNANRDILKKRDKNFVKELFDLEVNDDIADAICIGYAKTHSKPEPKPFNWE